MGDIVQRLSGPQLPTLSSSSRLPGRVVRQVEAASHTGLVAAAKVHAAAYTTHVAMQTVAMLSNDEARIIEMCPLAEPRVRTLVDQFTAVATFEIQKLAW